MASTRVLVVANRTAATPTLLDAVRERAARGACAFTLLVPNTAHGLHSVVDPEDQRPVEAEATLELALPLLEEAAGGPVEGDDRRPGAARRDPGRGQHRRLRRDHHLDAADARLEWLHLDLPRKVAGLGLPVTTVTAKGREGACLEPLASRAVSPFWIWTQVVIVVCVLAGAIIALTKLV